MSHFRSLLGRQPERPAVLIYVKTRTSTCLRLMLTPDEPAKPAINPFFVDDTSAENGDNAQAYPGITAFLWGKFGRLHESRYSSQEYR